MSKKQWWADAGLRALKTVTQTAVATIGSASIFSEVDWLMVLSASLMAGLVSLLMSVSALPTSTSTTVTKEGEE